MTSISNLVQSSIPHSQSILKVDLQASQNFGPTPVQKVVVPFKKEEDMILLCLSIFLHDFVHDYNLSSMHKRVIKGGAYDVLKTLKIGIKNPTFKIFSYSTASYGDVELYDDSKFEDVAVEPGSKISSYLNYIRENSLEVEIPDSKKGGGYDFGSKIPYMTNATPRQEIDIDTAEIKTDPEVKPTAASTIPSSKVDSTMNVNLTCPIVSDFTSKETYKTLIDAFTKNADFLGFHSGLNTFVVTYLGSRTENSKETPEFLERVSSITDTKSIEMHNLAMYNSILLSFDCIISDFKNNGSKSSDFSTDYVFLSDVFIILREAFVVTTNNDLKTDSLTILNSSNVLEQFIVFYILYLNQNNVDDFFSILKKQHGGQENENEHENESVDEEEAKEKSPYRVLEKKGQVETREYAGEEGPVSYYSPPEKKIYLGSESVFIAHNNLLTTIARGMFIKLGLWHKLFSELPEYSSSNEAMYTFGKKEIDLISYERLVALYPINGWKGGNFNNELLIMQILILKMLLLEMSPAKTLTFGAKIDDQLKNYLDVFYFTYFVNKRQTTDKPIPKIEEDVLKNPDIDDLSEADPANLFVDENSSEDEKVDFSEEEDNDLEGGGKENQASEIEMTTFRRSIPAPDEGLGLGLGLVPAENTSSSFADSEIISPGRPPTMPIVFRNLKKMYQNNIYTIQNLQSSSIPPITMMPGVQITNLYDLMSQNQTLMHRIGSNYDVPSPALKFVINNAANIAANINGSKMLYTKKERDEITRIVSEVKTITDFGSALSEINEIQAYILTEVNALETTAKHLSSLKRQNRITISEYNEMLKTQFDIKTIKNTRLIPCENKKYLIDKVVELNEEESGKGMQWLNEWSENCQKWFEQCQSLFGLYRNLVRGTFCPTTSMMDAMFNCSLKYGATEPKEVGTTHFELKYESEEIDPALKRPVKIISFAGVVLNYNEVVDEVEQLNAKIDFDLTCIDTKNGVNDIANISTIGMQVAESHDLKASVVYKCVVDRVKEIYLSNFGIGTEEDTAETSANDRDARETFLTEKANRMWSSMQIYKNKDNFNKLLGATSVKTFGDFLQECLACMKWGGYVNSSDEFPEKVKNFISENKISPIYRSVSDALKIVPYNDNGDALRLGIQGDRPSGFRSIYILMNGVSGINQQAIGGYVYTSANQKPSRTILVSRNSVDDTNNNTRKDGLGGKLIYSTRELPVIYEERLPYLKLLQYKTIREKMVLIDKETNLQIEPEIVASTIVGTSSSPGYKSDKKITSLQEPYNNRNYNRWDDYETPRIIVETESKTFDLSDPEKSGKKELNSASNEKKVAEKESALLEMRGMKEEEKRTKEIITTDKEIAEYRKLVERKNDPAKENLLTDPEKRRIALLKKKYPFAGGKKSKKRQKMLRKKVSHKKRKTSNKTTFKRKNARKNKKTQRK